jgi:tetratricopeptide (TPR) repeat protein
LLVLDADEVISKKDHGRLKEQITRSQGQRCAYTITTRNYDTNPTVIGWTANLNEYPDEERGTGWIPTHKVRLFPKRKGLYYSFPVHEMIEPALKKNGYTLEVLDVPVHHYGKFNAEKTKRKYITYYELGLHKLDETGDDAYALRELAIQAGLLKRYEEAIDLWRRFLKISPKHPEAYINMATAFFQLKEYQNAFESAKNAYKSAPKFRESIYNYALMALHVGDVDTAMNIGEQLVELHPNYQPGLFLYTCVAFSASKFEAATETLDTLRQTPLGPVLGKSFETFCRGLCAAGQDSLVEKILNNAREQGYWDEALHHLMKSAGSRREQRLAS